MVRENKRVLSRLSSVFCAQCRSGAIHCLWTVVLFCAVLFLLVCWPAYGADSPWPQESHDGRRTNYAPIEGIDDPTLVPLFPEGQEPFSAGAEGSIFIGPDDLFILRDGYYPGEHIALDNATKQILWRYPRFNVDQAAIGADGIIYVYGENRAPTALDPKNGAVLWQDTTITPAYSLNWIAAPVVDENGNVYFQIDSGFAVYAPGKTKKLLWSYIDQYTAYVYNTKGFAVNQGTIYFLESGMLQFLYAVNSNTPANRVKWVLDLRQYDQNMPDCSKETCDMNTYPVIGSDGTIYIRHYHYVLAIKDKGTSAELTWKTAIPGTAAFPTGVSPLAPPVLDDRGYLYVWSMVNDTLTLYCLDTARKGTIVWTKTIAGQTAYPNSIIGAGNRLYVLIGGTNDGALYGLDMTSGDIEFTKTYPGIPHGDMAIASDGTIYYTAYYYARDGHYYDKTTIMKLGKILNTPPTIQSFYASPTEGNAPLEVSFFTTAVDFEGDEIYYRWDFGDNQTSAEEDPKHTFTRPGIYTVRLTVTDSKGASSSATVTITVYEQELPPSGGGTGGGGTGGGGDNQTNPLSVSITATPTSGHAPLEVSFTATPNRVYQSMTYSWDFGDRTTGSGSPVTHIYTTPGTYTAKVTCRSTYYSATASVRIRVTPAGREVIGFDCLTIEADTMSCSDDGDTCTMSGNVVINDLITVDGSVTVDNSLKRVTGSGDLTITTDSGEEEVLSTGGFTIQGDMLDDDHDCCSRLVTDETFFWNLYGFQFDYQGMRIYDDHVEIPGTLKINFFVSQLQLEVTVIYSKRGRDFSGRLELPNIDLSGFELSDCYLDIDTFAGEFEGGATLKVPGLNFEIGSEIGFYYGVLNKVKVEIGDLNKPILYSPPPAPAPIVFLQSISGGLENIAPRSPDPIVLTAGATLTGGPKVELPSINLLSGTLKVGGGEYEMLGVDIDLEIDTGGRFTGEGTGYLLNDDFGTFGELVLILDIQRGVYFSGKLYYPPGEDFAMLIVTGAGKIDFGLNFQAALQGTLKAPNILWLIGGKTFGDAKAYIDNDLISAGIKLGDRICVPFVGCADLTIKVSVTFVFETGELSVAKNWDNIGEVTFSYGRLMSISGMAAAESGAGNTFTIDDNESAVIFRLEASGGDASFTLEAPDKTLYTLTSGNAFWSRNDAIGEIWCAVPNPQKGKWTMTVSGAAKSYTCQLLRQNAEPYVSITAPNEDITLTAGQPLTLNWEGDDPDDTAEVSLFYDDDREGVNGALICKNMPASGSYTWNTASVPPGRYYLYAKITDGKNTPVIAYSRAAVTVRSAGLPAPVIKSVAQGPDGLALMWDPVDGAAGYRIYYGSALDSTPLQQCPAIAVWGENGAALHHLVWGKRYRVAVSAFDRDGREGDLSGTVLVTMQNRSGNNAPVITSKPVTLVQAGEQFSYQIQAYDSDRDPITYSLQQGPPGMTISGRGLVSWTPRDSDAGTHRVTVLARDLEGASDNQTFDLTVLSPIQNIADPFVAIECSTTAGPAPLRVSFAAKTHDIMEEKLTFSWDFGDGTSSAEENPEHVFQERGVYTVILTVATQSGRTATASVVVEAGSEVATVEPPTVETSVSGSQVQFSIAPSGSASVGILDSQLPISVDRSATVQGYRMYLGQGIGPVDYEYPIDLGRTEEFVFYNVPAGLYTAVFRSYLAESGETWDSKKRIFAVPYAPKQTTGLPSGVLEGRVFDAQTLRPVPNAQVRFVFYRTRTDERGAFRFEGLPDIKKAYAIADAEGYRTASEAIAIQQGVTATCRILLWQGEDNQTCPAATYLPEHAGRLREFRDRVFAGTGEGRKLISAYYRAAPHLAKVLRADPELRRRTLTLARELMPFVGKALRGENVVIKPTVQNRINALISTYREKVGTEGVEFLNGLQRMVSRGTLK